MLKNCGVCCTDPLNNFGECSVFVKGSENRKAGRGVDFQGGIGWVRTWVGV